MLFVCCRLRLTIQIPLPPYKDGDLDDLDEEDLVYGVGAEFQLLGRLSLVGRFESIGGDIETVSAGVRLGF